MFGLYDSDGILRFTGNDRDACLAYAELFELEHARCSLLSLPDSQFVKTKRGIHRRRLELSSN